MISPGAPPPRAAAGLPSTASRVPAEMGTEEEEEEEEAVVVGCPPKKERRGTGDAHAGGRLSLLLPLLSLISGILPAAAQRRQ